MPPSWRNRIVAYSDEPPDQLLASPFNWRIHPQSQQDALLGVLRESGIVQNILVNRTTGNLIDGHLRVSLALREGQPTVPVTWVEISEAEEKLVLSVLDPIATMAVADKEKLDALLRDVKPESAALQQMLSALAAREGLIPPDDPMAEWQGMPEFVHEDKTAFRTLIVHFANEQDVQDFMERLEQSFSQTSKYIWYPKQPHPSHGRYVDAT